jgi:hypothetical protein
MRQGQSGASDPRAAFFFQRDQAQFNPQFTERFLTHAKRRSLIAE